MCGQSTAYNTYATLPYTNPIFMGFSCSQNVLKEINTQLKEVLKMVVSQKLIQQDKDGIKASFEILKIN